MSLVKKVVLAMAVIGAIASGSAQKLLSVASNAIESDAHADPGDHSGSSGSSCG